jgi:hypothetical protein
MKKILILLLLAPFALNAMDATTKSKPIGKKYIFPIFTHARADKDQQTVLASMWASGNGDGDTQVTILETIPNDETELFTVLYSIKNNEYPSPSMGAVIAKYGEQIRLGEGAQGLQHVLCIPKLGAQGTGTQIGTIRPPVNPKDLSHDAREFLALFAPKDAAPITHKVSKLTLASNNTNNNNNQ